MSHSARSYLLLHAVPAAQARQVSWTISRTLGLEPRLIWHKQNVIADYVSANFSWDELPAVTANLASALAGWGGIWFELMHEATISTDAELWLHTPTLGLRHRSTDSSGNIVVNEFELAASLERSAGDAHRLALEMQNLLAQPWTEELERFRYPQSKSKLIGLAG